MKATLDRIKEIDTQIAKLKLTLKAGEYLGAGLSLSICVGAVNRNVADNQKSIDLTLGVYSGMETELLNVMVKGLEATKSEYIKKLKTEVSAANEYLNGL